MGIPETALHPQELPLDDHSVICLHSLTRPALPVITITRGCGCLINPKQQCTRKTFMIHQTFVRWALYILLKFVKSLIWHLGLAIGNVWHVRWFSWTLKQPCVVSIVTPRVTKGRTEIFKFDASTHHLRSCSSIHRTLVLRAIDFGRPFMFISIRKYVKPLTKPMLNQFINT